MDPLSLGFLIVVAVMGGVIASAADRLGRRLGKKRLSLFGLRPRHTAEFITVLAGVVITILTLTVIMGASADVRRWLAEGPRVITGLQHQVADLESQEKGLRSEIQQKAHEIEQKTVAASKVEDLRQRAEAALAKTRETLTVAQGKATKLESKVREIEKRRTDLDAQLQEKLSELGKVQASLKSVQHDLEIAGKNRDYAQGQVNELNQQNLRLIQENQDREKEVTILKQSVISINQEISGLTTERDRLQTELGTSRSELSRVNNLLERTRSAVDALNLDLEQARALADIAKQMVEGTRTEPVIFVRGEELGRLSVDAGLDETEARRQVLAMLARADIVAKDRGAISKEGEPSAGLIPLRDSTGESVTAKEQEDRLVASIRGGEAASVLVAYASWNSFKGEFVPLRIFKFPNPIIYEPDAPVAETRINGSLSEEEILTKISEFLNGPVNKTARDSGMIPVSGAIVGDEAIGTVSPATLFSLVRQIKSQDRIVRVIAVAAKVTRASDSLQLAFRVR